MHRRYRTLKIIVISKLLRINSRVINVFISCRNFFMHFRRKVVPLRLLTQIQQEIHGTCSLYDFFGNFAFSFLKILNGLLRHTRIHSH